MTELPDKPKRLSLSEILSLMLTRQSAPRDSIDLERGMRGEIKISLSAVRHEEETWEDFRQRIAAEFDALCTRYPMSNGDDLRAKLEESVLRVKK